MQNNDMSELNFFDINVLKQTWKKGDSFLYEEKARPYHGICFIICGKIKYKTKDDEFEATAGDVVILKKNSHYTAFFRNNTNDMLVNFQCESRLKEIEFFNSSKKEIVILKNRIALKNSFLEIFDFDMMLQRKCMVKSKLYQIIDEICTAPSCNTDFMLIKKTIDNDKNFVMNEYDLAKKCMMSVSTLQRTFKKHCNKTISEYKKELKIKRAKELLNSTDHTTEQISEILGYCDSSHFSKSFKNYVGVSPKKYPKQH